MKTNLTMKDLQTHFKQAIAEKYKWFAIKVYIPGFGAGELILNPLCNIEDKLEYYAKAYDENLVHRQSGVIKIIDWDYADFVDELKFFDSKG
jgi:hypothetical protein